LHKGILMGSTKNIQMRERPVWLLRAGRAFPAACQKLATRVWPSARWGKSGERKEAVAWSGRLKDEKESLLSLVSTVEAEFVASGEGLDRLAGQLGEIQKNCQALTELTLGQTQDAAVQFAFQLLKKSEDLVLACYEQYDHVFATFREMQHRLGLFSKQRDEFMRLLWPLNFITMSFRIEASRHPPEVQQAFFTLAASVNQTVAEVRETLDRQFAELATSEQIVARLMAEVSSSVHEHRNKVALTLQTSRQHLHALSEALNHSAAGAADISQLNQSVERHINNIVMAQQCQDISRQKIEHIGEAMDEIRSHLAGNGAGLVDSETRQVIFSAAQIQLRQIQSVFDDLGQAAETLKVGMQGLRDEAGAAADVSLKAGDAALETSVAHECQTGVGEILSAVKQAVQRIADIVATFDPLQASFIDCTSKATELACDVRRAGLNAQVFAIHAPDGATLEVLAGRMREISDDCISQVEQMGATLRQTVEMVNNLRQRLEDFQILGHAEQDALTIESGISREKLSDLEGAIPVMIQGITGQQKTFAESVEAILAHIQFPAIVAAARVHADGFFQELVAWGSKGGAGSQIESGASDKLDRFKAKYTMASEREAHAAALQPTQVPLQPVDSQAGIELFDDFDSTPLSPPAGADPLPSTSSPTEPAPPESAASEVTFPVSSVNADKSTPGTGLGDNVELF
jgi:hypothetical protein